MKLTFVVFKKSMKASMKTTTTIKMTKPPMAAPTAIPTASPTFSSVGYKLCTMTMYCLGDHLVLKVLIILCLYFNSYNLKTCSGMYWCRQWYIYTGYYNTVLNAQNKFLLLAVSEWQLNCFWLLFFFFVWVYNNFVYKHWYSNSI